MRSLAGLSTRSLAHRKGRSLLTASGIALGVAVLFGVLVTNASVDAAFARLVGRFLRDIDVLVRPEGAYDATMPADVARRLTGARGVEAVSPSLGATGTVVVPGALPNAEPSPMYIVGLDLEAWRKVTRGIRQDRVLAQGRFYRDGEAEVVIGSTVPEDWKAKVDGTIDVSTPTGRRALRVVGQFSPSGQSTEVNRGVMTSLTFAQQVRGVGDVIDAITIRLDPSVPTARWIEENRELAGPGANLEQPGAGEGQFRPVLRVIQASLTFVAAIALFVGAFLIYLTLSMAVIERTRLYGTLRALGATRRQLRRLVVGEALTLGAVSTAVGLLLGVVMSIALVRVMAVLLDIARPSLVVSPLAVGVAVSAGMLTTLASALAPARRASRLSPVIAMRGDPGAGARVGRSWIAGACLVPGGLAVGAIGGVGALSLGTLALLLGIVLLLPAALRPLARALGFLTRRASAGVGPVAVLHLVRERSRSAYTLGLVMVVLAMTFTIGAAHAAMSRAVHRTIETQFGSDLRLYTQTGFAAEDERAIAELEGVRALSSFRFGNTRSVKGTERSGHQLVIVDPATFFGVAGFIWADGDERAARAAFSDGGGVVLSESTALRLGVERGETISLTTQKGVTNFDVAGIYAGIGNPQPIFVGLPDGRRWFAAGRPTGLAVDAEDDVDPKALRRSIVTGILDGEPVFVEEAPSEKAEARRELNGYFGVFFAILLVAAVIGLLGLTNTLLMSVLQRQRELGILRALGVLRRQLRSMVVVESATLVLAAAVLAVPLGSALALMFVRRASTLLGFSMDFVYPWAWVPVIAGLAALVGLLAASAPARRAARLQVVDALAYE